MRFQRTLWVTCCLLLAGLATPRAQGVDALRMGSEQLAKALELPVAQRPLVIQVGFRIMYQQAHIPGAEYIGPGNDAAMIAQLHKRVEPLPRKTFIVLYCGCCPWERCPNVKPASAELAAMGFSNVKVLFIANNFGTDWVDKGYPTQTGQ